MRSLEIERLESDSIGVEVLPGIGARVHRLRAFGHDLLRTPDDHKQHRDDPFFWGAYHLLPWANRVAAAATRVGGRTVELEPSFHDGTAIHGLHYATPWKTEALGVYAATGGGGRSGWPWPHHVRVAISLDRSAVRIRHDVTNLADDPMPAGAGVHPWFAGRVDVRIPASEAIASNTDSNAPHQPVGGELDLREFRELADGLDAAWAADGDAAFELRWPHLDIAVRVTASASAPTVYVAAANPGDVDAVAVEPQTHAPWGMRRLLDGERGGLTWLPPGESLTLDTQLSFRVAEKEQT